MVSTELVNIATPKHQELILTKKFTTRLQQILAYSLENWGGKVSVDFHFEVIKQVQMLPYFPQKNPKNSFLASTATKEFRNIVLKKYPYIITYSVTNSTIRVINIIHTSQDSRLRTQKY
jgi:plasmid stabilization system protein ParE